MYVPEDFSVGESSSECEYREITVNVLKFYTLVGSAVAQWYSA